MVLDFSGTRTMLPRKCFSFLLVGLVRRQSSGATWCTFWHRRMLRRCTAQAATRQRASKLQSKKPSPLINAGDSDRKEHGTGAAAPHGCLSIFNFWQFRRFWQLLAQARAPAVHDYAKAARPTTRRAALRQEQMTPA